MSEIADRLREEKVEKPRRAGLAVAICEVMQRVSYVPKTGENAFHRYRYASDEDLLSVLQPAMADAGLSMFPSDIEEKTVEHSTDRKGKPQWRTHVRITYTLLHVSGEERSVQAIGCGVDGEDKGVYKAMTGALKYALRHLFLVPTGNDPEKARRAQKAEAERQREMQAEQPTPQAPPPRPAPGAPTYNPTDWTERAKPFQPDQVAWFALLKWSKHPAQMKPARWAPLFEHCRKNADEVRAVLKDGRDNFRRAVRREIGKVRPILKKSDGARTEDIEKSKAANEAAYRAWLAGTYGVDSISQVAPWRIYGNGTGSLAWLNSRRDPITAEVDRCLAMTPEQKTTAAEQAMEADEAKGWSAP